ncbi:MAG: hypothetical protein JWQ35_277, partial [Bacteriovoracaceae bacterium]|nr:hypothetical protein [Bacteriovoracaceae bacterium]
NGLSAGITYRLQTQPSLAGSANVTNALGSLPTTVTQDPILPSNLQAGFSYEFIPDTVMMAFTYEWTQNSMLADISNVKGFGAFTGLGSDVVNGGVKARDDHEFHIGAEYTFHLAQHRKIRAGAGVCFDTAASRSDFPSAFLSPATFYKGYGLGGQYDTGSNVVGLAVNYGNNSKTSTTVDPTLAGSVFAGKYKLEEWLAVLDYQYRF